VIAGQGFVTPAPLRFAGINPLGNPDQLGQAQDLLGHPPGRRPWTRAWRSSGASARPRNRHRRGCGQRRPLSGTTRPVPRASKAWQRVWRFGRSSVERRIDRFIIPLGDCLALCRGPNPCPTVQVAADVPAATVLMEPRIRQTASRARQQSRLHRSHSGCSVRPRPTTTPLHYPWIVSFRGGGRVGKKSSPRFRARRRSNFSGRRLGGKFSTIAGNLIHPLNNASPHGCSGQVEAHCGTVMSSSTWPSGSRK